MSKKIRNRNVVSLGLVSLLLAACGSEQKPAAEPPPVKDTVFGDTVGAMDKARSVEATTMQHKEDMDRVLQENENPTAQ